MASLHRSEAILAIFISLGLAQLEAADRPSLHALLIGGGPDQESNAAQIEGHMRFVASLLPSDATRVILFADGNTHNATVSFTDSPGLTNARRALDVLLPSANFDPQTQSRIPNLQVPIDGPSRQSSVRQAMTKLASRVIRDPAPALIYTAGHGSRDSTSNAKSAYDLWAGEELTVRELAGELTRLPARAPVVLVMAQCFSGAFADVIFRKGDGDGDLVGRGLAGFFSATEDREAAGCGTTVDAANFQDFSSHFFGALSGRNLIGQTVRDADADGDGRVSLHEAFCYALVHDESVDTPTCTSHAFLKRFVPMKDAEIYAVSFSDVRAAASSAQRIALEGLSAKLGLTGEHRLLVAYDRVFHADPAARPSLVTARDTARDHLRTLRDGTLATLFAHWPALRWTDGAVDSAASVGAASELENQPESCRQLLDAKAASDRADDAVENEEAYLLRFTALCESIVRRNHLREGDDAKLKAQFERLWEAENRFLPLRKAE